MNEPLNVLVLDDAQDDFLLIERRLKHSGLTAHCQRAANLDDLKTAAAKGGWDVVLADYRVPTLEFTDTLAIHAAHLPDVPLILVSGKIGEEKAVELLTLGVWDFVLKDNLTRLAPAIERCVRDAANKRARQAAEAALSENEQRYRILFEHARDGMALADAETGRLADCNQALCHLVEREKQELVGQPQAILHPPQLLVDGQSASFREHRRNAAASDQEDYLLTKTGKTIPVEIRGTQVRMNGKDCLLGVFRDITERKQGEIRYHSLFENMLNGFAYCRGLFVGDRMEDFVYVAVNRAFETQTGLKNVSGRKVSEVIPGIREADPLLFEVYGRVARTGVPERFENYVEALQMWFDIAVYSPGKDHFVAVFDVITERKKAEKSLKESEALFSTTFHSAPIPISISEVASGKWVEVNQAFLDVTGYTRAEVIGHTFKDLTLWKRPEDRGMMQQALIEHGRVKNFEVTINKKGGATGTMLLSVEKVDLAGKPYLLILGNEITERKKAEEAHLRLSTAIEQAAEVIVITDDKATIQYVNPAFTRLTGYTRDEALGANPRVLQSGQHDAAFYRHMWDTLLAGQTWHGRFVNKRKDGTFFTEDAAISPVYDATGAIVNYVAVKRDVTRELGLEAQLLQAQKLESIGTLASGIAHDLNNILFPLLMGAQWFQEEQLTPSQREMAKTMETAATRGAEIIKQILTFARGTAGAKGPLQTKHVIREVLAMIRETFPRSIRIESSLAPELWPVTGDATQLHQVLLNLCVNARDAMPKGGTLRVLTENRQVDEAFARVAGLPQAGAYVVWTVEDTGEGIPTEILPKIFDPFFTTKAPGKGTGLGLSSVHGIVRDHGGAVRVTSIPGNGSTFQVLLPAQAYEAPAHDKTATLPRGKGELVLVVDDEAGIRGTIKAFLQAGGYTVITGRNGAEAVALCAEKGDVIKALILDMMMPEMGGEAALQIIRQTSPRLPVLVISGMMEGVSMQEDEQTALLMKPFGKAELLPALRQLLERGPKAPYTAAAHTAPPT